MLNDFIFLVLNFYFFILGFFILFYFFIDLKNLRFEFFKFFFIFLFIFFIFLYFLFLFSFFFFDFYAVPYYFVFDSTKTLFYFSLTLIFDGLSLIFLLLLSFLIPVCYVLNIFLPIQILLKKLYYKGLFEKYVFLNPKNNLSFYFNTYNFIYILLLLFLYVALFFFFTVSDIFFFYVLFESSMIPVYFMIGFFGSRTNRIKASYYLFFFTIVSSIFFLIAIILINYFYSSTNILVLYACEFNWHIQKILWFFFFVPFAVKVPSVPFHTWLPEAHVEASTEGSVILAGLLLKIGLFGIIRLMLPLLAEANVYFWPLINVFSLLSIIYISFIIFIQLDMKKIIAYSSIIHMNFTLLGLFSQTLNGIHGSIYLMFTHGFISSALFILIGSIYLRFNSRLLFYYQGLARLFPFFSVIFFILLLGNSGLPGTGGFIGEILILFGLFQKNFFTGMLAIIALLFSIIYSLLLFVRIFYGSNSVYQISFIDKFGFNQLNELQIERSLLLLFIFWVFLSGFFPNVYLIVLEKSILNTYIF